MSLLVGPSGEKETAIKKDAPCQGMGTQRDSTQDSIITVATKRLNTIQCSHGHLASPHSQWRQSIRHSRQEQGREVQLRS